MNLSIRGRMLLLVFSGVFAALLSLGATLFYSFEENSRAMENQINYLRDFLAESMGGYAEENSKRRLREVAEARAQHLDWELVSMCDDVYMLADSMSMIMSNPQYHNPRTLDDTRYDSVKRGTPYIRFIPELADGGMSESLRNEMGIAGNIADILMPMGNAYRGYKVQLFVASADGYLIAVDAPLDGDGDENGDYTETFRERFRANYDHRQSTWYKLGQSIDRPAFTVGGYAGSDGRKYLACVMPYYVNGEFAGVAGVSQDEKEIYRETKDIIIGHDHSNFVLSSKGEVVFSPESEGLLAAVLDEVDLRQAEEEDLAELARLMVEGKSGVRSIDLYGEIYYVAFAPMEANGWSFGVLIEEDEVMAPLRAVEGEVFKSIGLFHEMIEQSFEATGRRSILILIPVLLLLFYGSGFMASRLSRPIRRLAVEVKELAAGNFDKKLRIHTGDEIEDLADAFNTMTDELKTHMKNLELATAEHERVRTELEVATRIQEDMLPRRFPAFPERQEFDIYATMDAAKDVGGDFYDFYMPNSNHLVFLIADVSGKGIPAALFMAKSQSILKNSVLMAESESDVSSILDNANRLLCGGNDASMFVTVFLGVLDLRTGHLVYGDGGHCQPILCRNGSCDFLPMKKNSMLGLMELPYDQQSIELLPGDTIFLYTDGVSEAMNEKEEQFTEKRVRETLSEIGEREPEELLTRMRDILKEYAGTAQQSDDITMLGLKYNGNNVS
ncbi:MAG TPA: hypothetical protein DEP57_01655 [Selenomonas sp.]|nr:hypothetical protein [Selenomonas sp.]